MPYRLQTCRPRAALALSAVCNPSARHEIVLLVPMFFLQVAPERLSPNDIETHSRVAHLAAWNPDLFGRNAVATGFEQAALHELSQERAQVDSLAEAALKVLTHENIRTVSIRELVLEAEWRILKRQIFGIQATEAFGMVVLVDVHAHGLHGLGRSQGLQGKVDA